MQPQTNHSKNMQLRFETVPSRPVSPVSLACNIFMERSVCEVRTGAKAILTKSRAEETACISKCDDVVSRFFRAKAMDFADGHLTQCLIGFSQN